MFWSDPDPVFKALSDPYPFFLLPGGRIRFFLEGRIRIRVKSPWIQNSGYFLNVRWDTAITSFCELHAIMILILDVDSDIGAHVRKICVMICIRQFINSREAQI